MLGATQAPYAAEPHIASLTVCSALRRFSSKSGTTGLWLIPGHCDPTVNLHDVYVGLRGGLAQGVVESIWAVDARGCLT
jgi:hypothetical protein